MIRLNLLKPKAPSPAMRTRFRITMAAAVLVASSAVLQLAFKLLNRPSDLDFYAGIAALMIAFVLFPSAFIITLRRK